MKTKVFMTTAIALLLVGFGIAQHREFSLANKKDNIPFGQKPTVNKMPLQNEWQKKMFQSPYAIAVKNQNAFDEMIARNKKSAPYLFNDSNSFMMQHLETNGKTFRTKNII